MPQFQTFSCALVALCLLLINYATAQPSCASILPSIILPRAGTNSTQLCSIETSDSYNFTTSISAILQNLQDTTINITFSSLEDDIELFLYRSEGSKNIINFSHKNIFKTYSLNSSHKMLQINISQQHLMLGFDSQTPMINLILKATTSPYQFKITTSKLASTYVEPAKRDHKNFNPRFLDQEVQGRELRQCPQGFYLSDVSCVRVCPANNFRADGKCETCFENCDKCLSATKCNPCQENHFYNEETFQCTEKCPPGHFEDIGNALCVKCVEGCQTCTYPYGVCNANYMTIEVLIDVGIAVGIVILIFLIAYLCSRSKKVEKQFNEVSQPTKASQQPHQQEQSPNKESEKSPQKNKKGIQYNLFEDQIDQEEDQEAQIEQILSEEYRLQSNVNSRRFVERTHARIPSVTISKKPFMVDDSNEEKAICHDSTARNIKLPGSPLLLTRIEMSPMLNSRICSSTNTPRSELIKSTYIQALTRKDYDLEQECKKGSPKSRNELNDMQMAFSSELGFITTHSTSPEISSHSKILKRMDSALSYPKSSFASSEELIKIKIKSSGIYAEALKRGRRRGSTAPPSGEKGPAVLLEKVGSLQEANHNEGQDTIDCKTDQSYSCSSNEPNDEIEIEDINYEQLEKALEENEKGYAPDQSLSMSRDKDGFMDYLSCNICGINKRECLNKPCGHIVGCFTCMKQMKNDYGICPRCMKPVHEIERVKTRRSEFTQEDEDGQ